MPVQVAPHHPAATFVLCSLLGCASSAAPAPAHDALAPAADAGPGGAGELPTPVRVQVFSLTRDFRHDSIATAHALFETFDRMDELSVRATEDPALLIEDLADTDVVVFLSTSGDVLDESQQLAFEAFIRDGGGFVGVHAAADTEYDWPFYGELLGARFESHPAVQSARVLVAAAEHPATAFLPAVWQRSDEWYNFDRNPREEVEVLLTVDETSYTGGTQGADHPIAWCRRVGKGRSLFTALGHTQESWSEPLFHEHVKHAVLWAAQR